MIVLKFTSKTDAIEAVKQINHNVGCSIELDNGYKMKSWSDVYESYDATVWWVLPPKAKIYGTEYKDVSDIIKNVVNAEPVELSSIYKPSIDIDDNNAPRIIKID